LFYLLAALLNQFHLHGLPINKSIAINAKLVKFASHPISNGQIAELKYNQNSSEAKQWLFICL